MRIASHADSESGRPCKSAGQAGPWAAARLRTSDDRSSTEGDRVKRLAAFGAGLWRDEQAEISLEYGLLVAMVALAMVVVFGMFGGEVSEFFARVTRRVEACTDVPGQAC
jgi:Flp pilus assembly pilin Flp